METWLSKQFTYTMHKPVRYHFKTSRVFAESIDYQWQADLVDFGSVQNTVTAFDICSLAWMFSQICLDRSHQKQDWSFSGICIQNYFVNQLETNIPTNR